MLEAKQKAIVFGAGLSGNGAKKLLEKKGYRVYLIDDKVALPTGKGIEILNSEEIEFIVKSPGIPWTAELLKEAEKKGTKIVSEIDLAYEHMDKTTKIIGITGTNGKTTTVTKIYELLEMAGKRVALSGNVGNSFAEMVADEKKLDYVVLELSSYQLENNPKVHCHISGIINLTPDHLSRYENLEGYYLTKFNIFKNQNENDFALINTDDKEFMAYYNKYKENIEAKKIELSRESDIFEKIIDTKEIGLKGKHNLENLLFVVGVANILNIPSETVAKFLKETKPLEHRLENFFIKENTVFINDSKGTNVDSTLRAIEAFDNKIILILGGDDKKVSNEELIKKVKERVSFVYLIGDNAEILIEEMEKQNYKNYKNLVTLENVVNYLQEHENFEEEKTVLLSPATSSWCQYPNFEERGKDFKNLVQKIIR